MLVIRMFFFLQWSLLVQTLLEMCKEETDSDDSESRKEAIMVVLKGANVNLVYYR